jgi:hypothetical protein
MAGPSPGRRRLQRTGPRGAGAVSGVELEAGSAAGYNPAVRSDSNPDPCACAPWCRQARRLPQSAPRLRPAPARSCACGDGSRRAPPANARIFSGPRPGAAARNRARTGIRAGESAESAIPGCLGCDLSTGTHRLTDSRMRHRARTFSASRRPRAGDAQINHSTSMGRVWSTTGERAIPFQPPRRTAVRPARCGRFAAAGL